MEEKEPKKQDGRKNNRGVKGNKGGRRPKKKDEDRIRGFAISAIKDVYGSEEAGWRYIAEKSKDSYPHLKLLWEYTYGKPKENVDLNILREVPLWD